MTVKRFEFLKGNDMNIVCLIFGHKKKYVERMGWIGYSSKCARCKKPLAKVIKTYKL